MTVLEALQASGVQYVAHGEHHHTSSGWINLDCPLCSPGSGRYRLGYNLERGNFHCWQCGSVPAKQVLHELTGLPWDECKELAASTTILPEITKRGTLRTPEGLGPLLEAHNRYLRERGFEPLSLSSTWGIGGIGPIGRFAWRIFIPVVVRGEILSYTTRAINDEVQPRYLSARAEDEAVSAKTLLLGQDMVGHTAIVTEGPFDAFRIGPGAVATLGLAVSRDQILLLSKIPKRIVCFDNEPNAQVRAASLCTLLSAFPGQTLNVTLDAKDAAEASEKDLEILRGML